jgi:hypothetical protein
MIDLARSLLEIVFIDERSNSSNASLSGSSPLVSRKTAYLTAKSQSSLSISAVNSTCLSRLKAR